MLLASALFAGLPWALAVFVGAALAPTDAALSAAVINDDEVPRRLRRALNVESGLNDGIATPIVTVALAVAATEVGAVDISASTEVAHALRELGVGLLIGLGMGIGGAALINASARRGWMAGGARRLAVLALAVGGYALAVAVESNGFIAAFVAGAAFGATLDRDVTDLEESDELPELGGELLALIVWFLFGAVLLPVAFHDVDARTVAYALASLTIVRMVCVAVSLIGSRLDGASVVFVGWFGPRGLASVVFALLAVEGLPASNDQAPEAIAVVTLTVLLSVVLHGITAGPGARRYLRVEAGDSGPPMRARKVLGSHGKHRRAVGHEGADSSSDR